MSGHGLIPYDLAGNWCEECGQPKFSRLFGTLGGDCATCNEAMTRHRCTKRPDLSVGQSWECPDCGTLWTAGEEEETCGECGQGIGTMLRTWDSVPGDRMDTAPKHKPVPLWTPFRNALPRPDRAYAPPSLPKDCYRMTGGSMVHVKPGCRCA